MRTRIPAELERRVVARLYADAVALDWYSLGAQEHTAQYARWVRDPDVGGRLGEYLTEAALRVWIKDGPMKELSRANNGVGPYARLVPGADGIPARLVAKVLGPEWDLEPGSLRGKPLRLTARHHAEDREVVLTWGQVSDLKHLVWAALRAATDGDAKPWTLCLMETLTRPTPANERGAHLRLGERCQLTIRHVRLEETP